MTGSPDLSPDAIPAWAGHFVMGMLEALIVLAVQLAEAGAVDRDELAGALHSLCSAQASHGTPEPLLEHQQYPARAILAAIDRGTLPDWDRPRLVVIPGGRCSPET